MEMVIKHNASLVDAVQAFILIVRNYQKKGYIPSAMSWKNVRILCSRFCDYIGKAKTFNQDPSQGEIVVVKKFGIVVGTICVWFNPAHTPIDNLFPDELARLRNSTARFVYLGSFAIASKYNCTRLSLRMLRDIWETIEAKGIENGVCVVHPDHVKIYERFGFRVEAISENMLGLAQAPATLMVIKRHEVRL